MPFDATVTHMDKAGWRGREGGHLSEFGRGQNSVTLCMGMWERVSDCTPAEYAADISSDNYTHAVFLVTPHN